MPYSITKESYGTVTRTGGSTGYGGTWYVCFQGTRMVHGMCLEPMALTLHSRSIALSIAGAIVGYSCSL